MQKTKLLTLKTALGYNISLTEFSSENSNKIVVICSATGVLQRFYYKLSEFLQAHNFTIYTFDYGGIGSSKEESLKTFNASLSNWATNDIEAVFQYLKKRHSQSKINCICHSLGGQLLGLVPSNLILNNIILVASQTNYFTYWSKFNKVRVFFNWFVVFPFFTTFFNYFPSKKITQMENLPKNVAIEFSRWSRNKNYYFELKQKNELFHYQIKGNLTSYSCINDKFAPKKAVDWMTKKYYNASTKRIHYVKRGIGYFGFFRSEFKNTIWQDFLKDLKA